MSEPASHSTESIDFIELLLAACEITLKERTTAIVCARYGLITRQAQTLQQVGDTYAVSRERVRQIAEKGLRRVYSTGRQHIRHERTDMPHAQLVLRVHAAVRPGEPDDDARLLALARQEVPHLTSGHLGVSLVGRFTGDKAAAAKLVRAARLRPAAEPPQQPDHPPAAAPDTPVRAGSPVNADREFVRARFRIVKARLDDPTAVIERIDRIQLEREYRLLGKLLDEVHEGRVLEALESWRRHLGGRLATYNREVLPGVRRAYIEWQRLPPERREFVPAPPPPVVSIKVIDRNGYTWVVDDRLLMMMDDLTDRLNRWLASAD
jgi:hypothetical protein